VAKQDGKPFTVVLLKVGRAMGHVNNTSHYIVTYHTLLDSVLHSPMWPCYAMLRAHDSDDTHHNAGSGLSITPVMQLGEIRSRAHGHESIDVLNFAARVPKEFAPVYSDVQTRLEESKS
jgi:hypothetical protein